MATFIAHAHWAEGRAATLTTLLDQVPGAQVVTSYTREHSSVWALRLWRTAFEASKSDEWCTFLNDDVTVAFNHEIETMLACVSPDFDAVSLATIQSQAREAYGRGECFLASYLATGPGYSIRHEALGDLIAFFSNLPAGMKAKMNEDEVLSHWAWSHQRPFLQCLPALVDHNVDVPSTLGYDNHPGRRATLLWHEVKPRPWKMGTPMYCAHTWIGEGRMRAVRRAITNGWDFDDKCVFCADRDALILSPTTGAGICGRCVAEAVGHVMTNARVA